MKKIFITLISICLILSLAPVSAFAEGTEVSPNWIGYYPEQLLVFSSGDVEIREDGKISFPTEFNEDGSVVDGSEYKTSLLSDTIPWLNYILTSEDDNGEEYVLGITDTTNDCAWKVDTALTIKKLDDSSPASEITPIDGKYGLNIKKFGIYELSVKVNEKKYWFNLNVSPWRRFDPNALYAFAKTDPAVKGLGDSEEDQYYKLIEYTMGEDDDVHTALDEAAPFRQEFTLENANNGLYIASAGYDNDKAVFITGISPYIWIKEYGKDYPIDQGEERGDMYVASEDGSYKFNLEDKKVYQIYHARWSTLIGIGDFKDTYSRKLMYKLPDQGNIAVSDNTINLNSPNITKDNSGNKQIYMLIEKSESEILTRYAYLEHSSKWRSYGNVIGDKDGDGNIVPKAYEVDGKKYNAFAISLGDSEAGETVSFGTVHGKLNMFPITGVKIVANENTIVTPPSSGGSAPVNPVDEAKTKATAKIEEIIKAVDTAGFTDEEKKTISDISAETAEALKAAKNEEEVKTILAEAEAKVQTAEAKYTIGHNTVDFKVKAVTKVLKNGGIRVSFRFVSGEEGIEQLKAKGYKISYQFLRSTKKNGKYVAKLTKDVPTYKNTAGKKGKKYFYKMALKIEDPNGRVVYETPLDKCISGSSVFKK